MTTSFESAFPVTKEEPKVLDRFDIFPHIEDCMSMTLREWLYFHNVMHRHYTQYLGRKILKPPFDWIVLGDIITDTKPEVIIEIGSYDGGSALWMANLFDAMGWDGTIIGVDIIDRPTVVQHPKIKWVIGDCNEASTIRQVEEIAAGRRTMLIEDSDHKYTVTKGILDNYSHLVSEGCYIIVEDTIVEHVKLPPFPGPLKAVTEFVDEMKGKFVIDRAREKYIITYNPQGYLLRVK